jgi:hypothetical protein
MPGAGCVERRWVVATTPNTAAWLLHAARVVSMAVQDDAS